MHSGRAERLPYSLSRWTDVSAAKWAWFEQRLAEGWMLGIDPRTAMPGQWSLKPEDTLGLIFWTKDPENLLQSADQLKNYDLVIHMTATGWVEVEKGAPNINQAIGLMWRLCKAFGPENIIWRFSPVPLVKDAVLRFEVLASNFAKMGIQQCFVSFLQENDLMPEARPPRVRRELLKQMASRTDLQIRLCAEDTLDLHGPANLARGVCEPGVRFGAGRALPTEGCGCALAVDPFTINESCTLGCEYCYAADKSLAPKKRNTTRRSLKVVP